MAGELRLFIPPPFTGWTLVDPYGPEDPVPASGPVMHYDTTLTSSGDGKIYAAVAGRLTIRTPGCSQGYPFVPLPPPPVVPFHSTSVELFLEPIALPRTLRAAASGFGNLRGFRYRNVDLQTLIDALADIVGAGALTVGPGPLRSPTQLLTEMLYGLRTVNVPVGHLLGSGSTNGAASGHRLVGFAAIADSGPIDPSHVYDELRDFVADGQPAVDAFVTLSPTQWPLIPPDAPFTTVLASASQNLYSMAVLRDFSPERNTNITAVQWRSIGDAQKAQWRERLLVRTAHAVTTSTAPPFEFNDLDPFNVFQLEAITEFYANFAEPWGTAAPRQTNDPQYVTVNFLDPSGTNATAVGTTVTLNAASGLTDAQITALLTATQKYAKTSAPAGNTYYDLLILDDDQNAADRPGHAYRIVSISATSREIVVDAAPTLTGQSAWTIRRRPIAVLIDSFGGLSGLRDRANATVLSGTTDQLQLDANADLERITPLFDTIYLPDDTAPGAASRPARTYRIQAKNVVARRLTLDASPTLPAAGSRWSLPSGVGGATATANDAATLGTVVSGNTVYDNYEGRLFLVYGGQIEFGPHSWSSYTSRETPNPSIRGNARYLFNSYRSTTDTDPRAPAWRNFCFRVIDPDLTFQNNGLGDSDAIAHAKRYFDAQVTESTQQHIRLHAGSTSGVVGSGSAGCLTSREFWMMRRDLIELYQREYRLFHDDDDPRFVHLADKDTQTSQTYYRSNQAVIDGVNVGWNSAIVGELWLIRPDERPVG